MKKIRFKECHDGIYYHQVGPDNYNKYNNTINDHIIVKTVNFNKAYFTHENIEGVDRSR